MSEFEVDVISTHSKCGLWNAILVMITCVVGGAVFSGCSSKTAPEPNPKPNLGSTERKQGIWDDYDPVAKLPSYYHCIYASSLGDEELKAAWNGYPYDSIQLERTECLGSCPAYVVTLHKGGRAEFEGKAHVNRLGLHSGKIDPWTFGRLCYALDQMKFDTMQLSYNAPWTDSPTTIVRVTRVGASDPISVSDYGNYGPIDLWTFQMAVDGAVSQIEWKKQ